MEGGIILDKNEKLLSEIYKVIQEYSTNNKQSYNVFKVLEMTDKEVLMCRVLTDFLSPCGLHNKGTKYLYLFLREVLHRQDAQEICETARVYKEYPITEDRRIDIVIESQKCFIPIEVKIHAGEQKAQCYDYYHYAKKREDCPSVVYLTKWGTMPSSYSMKSTSGTQCLDTQNVFCISFSDDICHFLELIIENETDVVMQEMAHQYKEAIESFTLFLGEELKMDISEKMLEREEYFRSMLAIEKAAKHTKAMLIYKVLNDIECQMKPICEKYGLEKETKFDWYEYSTQATEQYYTHRESTYPGINYVKKDIDLPDGIELWFRIEVDYALFAGLCLFDKNADLGNGNQLDNPNDTIKNELSKYINVNGAVYDAWWVEWWYLPTALHDLRLDSQSVPNFKEMNEAAIQLSNEMKRKEFTTKVISVIDKELERLFWVNGEFREDI